MQKYLEEKKNDLLTRAEEILETAKAETRELTEEEVKEFESIKDESEKINAAETLKAVEDAVENAGLDKEEE